MSEQPQISFLVVSRNRFKKLTETIRSIQSNLSGNRDIEILIALDIDDDTAELVEDFYQTNSQVKVFRYPRYGYKNIVQYFRNLYEHVSDSSTRICLWGDDSLIQTKNWDDVVMRHGLGSVLCFRMPNSPYEHSIFHCIPKQLLRPLGFFDVGTQFGDSWIHELISSTQIIKWIDVDVDHVRFDETQNEEDKDEVYLETSVGYRPWESYTDKQLELKSKYFRELKDFTDMHSKKRLLYITPHLSTGGLPQYQYRLIRETMDDFDVYCIEYAIHALPYNVQRNKIIEMLGEGDSLSPEREKRFYTLHGENSDRLVKLRMLIEFINPDIIHLQEMPEYFMDDDCCKLIYTENRQYVIVETSHDSSFDSNNKRWFPDQFVMVSDYQKDMLSALNIPIRVVYYPIDHYDRPDRTTALEELGLDPSIKHVLNVGLFTPRKNQAEVIEYARKLEGKPIQFHFVGNQADNFKSYWEPLLKDLPSNCKVWGERHDVEKFYGAMDLFLFTSRGHDHDKETSPIVIRESIGWNIPALIFPLSVYKGMYDEFDTVTYMDFDDKTKNINLVLEKLGMQDELPRALSLVTNRKRAVVISTFINSEATRDATRECIAELKRFDVPIILCSHSSVPASVSDLVDACIIDNHNPLMEHSYYKRYLNDTDNIRIELNLGRMTKANQSLTVQTNYYNGVQYAKSIGIDDVVCMNYDLIVGEKDDSVLTRVFNDLLRFDAWFMEFNEGSFKLLKTVFFGCSVDWFLDTFPNIRTPHEYNTLCSELGCENFIENFYHTLVLKNTSLTNAVTRANIYIDANTNEESLFPNSKVNLRSYAEYITVVPIKGSDDYVVFVKIPNVVDSRTVYILERLDNKVGDITVDKFTIKSNHTSLTIVRGDEPKNVVVRQVDNTYSFHDIVFRLDDDTRQTISLNGEVELKNSELYNRVVHSEDYTQKVVKAPHQISAVHLQTNDDRVRDKEQKSRESLRGLDAFGLKYTLVTNKVYTKKPPVENCARPQYVTDGKATSIAEYKHGESYLTPAHYGCFLSFKDAVLNHWQEGEFLLILEGDCLLETSVREFTNTIFKACTLMKKRDIGYFSFGDDKTLDKGWKQSPVIEKISDIDWAYVTNHIIGIQSIMFSPMVRNDVQKAFSENPWLETDAFINNLLIENHIKMALLTDRMTTQVDGFSLLDGENKVFLK